jgi:hypothetical protein
VRLASGANDCAQPDCPVVLPSCWESMTSSDFAPTVCWDMVAGGKPSAEPVSGKESGTGSGLPEASKKLRRIDEAVDPKFTSVRVVSHPPPKAS